ncbi:InlB B-repeat-containing protein [Enterococcus sp. DIV0756]|uniref:InlB B-repeat-containing protein n=1 Tax=Enterococcus sp. DIV0756 TaxID=2774636 RepID=UPI003F2449BF
MKKKPIAYVGTSILLFSTLLPTGIVFAESISIEAPTEQTGKTLESVQSKVGIPEQSSTANQVAPESSEETTSESSEAPVVEETPQEEKEETITPNVTFKQKTNQAIKEDEKVEFQLFGNLTQVTLALPEGLTFDVQDHLDRDDKPSEDYAWNEEKRELTIKNISEEEDAAKALILTAEKAGHYELTVFDKEANYESEMIGFDVAEKEKKTEESTKESKEETTDSSKEETKDSEKAVTKAKKAPRANDVTVGIKAEASFRTYTDPLTGLAPSEYAVAVPLSVSTAGLTGVTVEIPYGFTPDPTKENFKHFTMTDPIFSFIDPGVPAAESIVDHYEDDTVNQKLIIHLKETKTTVETLNLRFKFNEDYDAKIPANQVIWQDLQATVYDSTSTQMSQSGKVQLKSETKDGLYPDVQKFTPTGDDYSNGAIINRLTLYNNNNKLWLLDESYNNRFFIEVPTGSTLSSEVTDYFGTDGKITSDDSSIPTGYTRYYRAVTDDSSHFNYWQLSGSVNSNRHQITSRITPPSSILEDDTFSITLGMITKKFNEKAKTVTHSATYTKKEQADWEITTGRNNHDTGTAGNRKAAVVQGASSSTSLANYAVGYSNYGNVRTYKNTGKRDITGTSFTLYHKGTGSEKVNFNSITVYGTVLDDSTVASYYKANIEIVNMTGGSRVVSTTARKGTHSLALPVLNPGEYINKVTAIPMGTDGETPGAWPTGNGVGFGYTAKNWDSDKWPDDTKIPTDKLSKVEMGASLTYDNEENGQAPTPMTVEMDTGEVIYTPNHVTDAYATFVSNNANSRQPGDTVNYEIQGYNTLHAIGDWKNPEISIAIPKVLVMENPGANKDFYDEKTGTNYPGVVQVELLGSDTTNNYYRFKVTGNGQKVDNGVSFKIPITFKVASGTPVGNDYTIPAVAASGTDFLQMDQETNNFSDALASKLNLDNTIAGSYTGKDSSKNTTLSIVYATKLNGDSAGRSSSTDAWTETTHFAVEKKSTPQMKATVSNIGNTSFNNVRLYDILPSSSDGRGSTGNISFTGLENAGGTVYYTTDAVSTLPDYTSDLQTWNAAKLASHGFSTTKPLDMTKVTAIYIDFGTKVVAPNEDLDTVLNFLVPDADNQKAINQFRYSAKEVGSGTPLNANSSEITFSTEMAKVAYEENLPSFLAPGVTAAGDMPTTQSVLLDASGKGSIKLSDKVPTLTGYTFVKWQDKANPSKDYQPGANIDFTSASTELNLKAIWKAVSVDVTYKKNDGTAANVDVKTYSFGDTVNVSPVTEPTRTGYTFKGWGTTEKATTADFVNGTTVDFVTDKTVYAIWEANTYAVQFDKNGGEGTMTNQAFTYDTTAKLKKNAFTRPGYAFKGWAKVNNAVSAEFVDEAPVDNLTTTDKGTVKLFAVWAAEDQAIQFDVNGGDVSSKPDDIIQKTDTTVDIDNVKNPTRTGYAFDGWYDGTTEITGTIKMPAGGKTLIAKWKANQYKVTFNANKGTGTMAAQQFTYGATQMLTANTFTRSGYTFVGWATTAGGTSAYVDQQSVSDLTAKNNETIALYAVWSANPQVLQFDVNGGDISSKPKNIDSTTDATVDISSVKAPTKTGYKFTGWYDGATKVGNSIVMPAGGKTLRAEWEAITYKVNYDANTGSGVTMAQQSFTYDQKQNLAKNTYVKAGYAFEGWITAKNHTTSDYVDGQDVVNLSDTQDAEVTLYASWRAENQTVNFDVNQGDVTTRPLDIVQPTDSTVDISTVAAPTRTGYKFAGWYDGASKSTNTFTMPAGGKTLRAEWTPIKYSIEFDGNSGKGTMSAQSFDYDLNQALSKNIFTKAGYSFTGWSMKKGDPVVYSDEQDVQNLTTTDGDKIKLFANWKADDQTVTFDINGGDEATKPANIVQPTDSTVDLTKVKEPKRTGYIFQGWYETSTKAEDTFTMPAGGKNLRAEWKAIKYAIEFDGNSGEGTMKDQAFEYDLSEALSKNKFTKAGYSFTGWSTKKGDPIVYTDEQAVKNLTTTDGDKIKLFANWKADDQTVTFDINGGDEATKPANIVQPTDSTVDLTKVKAPSRTGYIFDGWYEASTKSDDSFTMPAGGKTLQAKWIAITYSVKFDSNSGTGKMSDQTFEYDVEQKLTKNDFAKAGYSFTGWSSKKDGEVEYKDEAAIKNLTTTNDEVITMYAIWQAEDQTIKFDVNGGDKSSKPADIVAKTDEKVDIDKVEDPTRDGYDFTGWYLKTEKISGVIDMPAGGMTLVAQWTKKDAKGDGDGKLPGTGDSGTGTSNSKTTIVSGRVYRGGTTNNNSGTSAKNLPKTGSEYQSPLTALMGLCLVAGTTALAWFRRNKKDTE